MSRGSSDDGLFWLVAIAVLGVGAWVYVQVKAFATWAGLDMDSTWSLLLRGAVLIILLGVAWWGGWLRKASPYVPCALVVCLKPALDYWSVHVVNGMAMSEPAWYGQTWIQVMAFVGLAAVGFLVSRQFDS
ncbi:hypothetical protein ACXKTX_02215 [Burkholderia gladioli]